MSHTGSLLRVARRLTGDAVEAEDLVQETLLLAWRGFGKFRNENGRAWVFRILMNAHRSHARKNRASPAIVSLLDAERATPGRQESASTQALIGEALDALSEDHRRVLLLGVVEGFTCREMSEILSVPIGTVMSRLSRAREALLERLSGTAGVKNASSAKESAFTNTTQ
jgi:RNA polymerase sigma-70 factor, ECF subfamily